MIFLINSKMLFCSLPLSNAWYNYKGINKSGTQFCIRLQEVSFFFIILMKQTLRLAVSWVGRVGLFLLGIVFVSLYFSWIHQLRIKKRLGKFTFPQGQPSHRGFITKVISVSPQLGRGIEVWTTVAQEKCSGLRQTQDPCQSDSYRSSAGKDFSSWIITWVFLKGLIPFFKIYFK